MSETASAYTGGGSEAEGGVRLSRMPASVYQEHRAQLRNLISLSPDVVEEAMVTLDSTGAATAWVKARGANGEVSQAIAVEVPERLAHELDRLLTANRDAVRDQLLDGIADTLVAARAEPATTEGEG